MTLGKELTSVYTSLLFQYCVGFHSQLSLGDAILTRKHHHPPHHTGAMAPRASPTAAPQLPFISPTTDGTEGRPGRPISTTQAHPMRGLARGCGYEETPGRLLGTNTAPPASGLPNPEGPLRSRPSDGCRTRPRLPGPAARSDTYSGRASSAPAASERGRADSPPPPARGRCRAPLAAMPSTGRRAPAPCRRRTKREQCRSRRPPCRVRARERASTPGARAALPALL